VIKMDQEDALPDKTNPFARRGLKASDLLEDGRAAEGDEPSQLGHLVRRKEATQGVKGRIMAALSGSAGVLSDRVVRGAAVKSITGV
jgi:hypothetical protein